MEDLAELQRQLGPSDREKVNQYLESVREVERRIQTAETNTKERLHGIVFQQFFRESTVPAAKSFKGQVHVPRRLLANLDQWLQLIDPGAVGRDDPIAETCKFQTDPLSKARERTPRDGF